MAIVTMQIITVKTLFLGGWWNFSLKKIYGHHYNENWNGKSFLFFFGGGDFSLTIFMAIIRVLEILFYFIISKSYFINYTISFYNTPNTSSFIFLYNILK